MAKSIKVKPKKRGRPATGKDPMVGARLPPDLTTRIDAWAKKHGMTRSAAIRALIEASLAGFRG
jgi:predicted DNA-binding protein